MSVRPINFEDIIAIGIGDRALTGGECLLATMNHVKGKYRGVKTRKSVMEQAYQSLINFCHNVQITPVELQLMKVSEITQLLKETNIEDYELDRLFLVETSDSKAIIINFLDEDFIYSNKLLKLQRRDDLTKCKSKLSLRDWKRYLDDSSFVNLHLKTN